MTSSDTLNCVVSRGEQKMRETRVGCVTIDILSKELEGYIKAFTVNSKYTGNPEYIRIYLEFREYLKTERGKKNED